MTRKVLFVGSEAAPFIKTGGLGDVLGALPKSLVKRDVDARVILPLYADIKPALRDQMEFVLWTFIDVGWRHQYVGLYKAELDGVTFYFVDNQDYFGRKGLYGFDDDAERFAFFQLAVMNLMERIDFVPDILHVHDYHAGMIPFLLKEKFNWIEAYNNIQTVLTIHNIEFQGQFDPVTLPDLFGVGLESYFNGQTRQGNTVNWLKSGIVYADRVSTVSPSYAFEIRTPEFGVGLDGVLRMYEGKVSGITNGIDADLYNPETDKHIPYHFSVSDLSGKVKDKAALQKRAGLPVRDDVAVVGIVSRLTYQKGFDLVVSELKHILNMDVQVVVLGTGYANFEHDFQWFAAQHPDKMSANITFDLEFAQMIYAGADIFLMPSAFEPCGLSQMMSMRYGTLPLVHEIGGLKDTVAPYNAQMKTGTGFGFNTFTGYWLTQTLVKALDVFYNDKDSWNRIQHDAMVTDFSWDTASQHYVNLYNTL